MKYVGIVDRKTYIYKGTWRNPNQDVDYVFYYYFVQPLTLRVTSQYGKEQVRPSTLIGIFGQHPFVKGDKLTLHDGTTLQIGEITLEYYEGNIRIRNALVPRVREMVVELS